MIIGNMQERLNVSLNAAQDFISHHKIKKSTTDEKMNNGDRDFKKNLLADETCHLLFGHSTNLLADILSDSLAIDYFNVYLSLPIFGQRAFCHRITQQFDFDPPLLAKRQTCNQIYEEAKEWLINCRLDNYLHTDIYIESLLALLLIKKLDNFNNSELSSKGIPSEFSTVTDIRQFHQFLQSTSGIKYWNFFIDSMRLLRFRYSSQSNRIDISHLNFIYKYYSQHHEFRSIIIDLGHSQMPDSNTPDAIYFQMAINAIHQLRAYWLPRYLAQLSSSSRSKINHSIVKPKSNQADTPIKSLSENLIVTPLNLLSHTDSVIKEPKFAQYTLGNMSYIDYNPRQYIRIQPSEPHSYQGDVEEINEPNNDDPIEIECKINLHVIPYSSSNRSIADYATDGNIELFYRIFVSDSLAAWPFLEYISQTIPKKDAIPIQKCIRFIADAEVLLSIESHKFKQRFIKQFISRYLEITSIEELPNQLFDSNEEQRIDLIKELTINENNHYSLLWKVLLNMTKILLPYFLDYIKFDRLRFLVQGKALNKSLVFDDLRRFLSSVNFETLLTNQRHSSETDVKPRDSDETGICSNQLNDLIEIVQHNTTEKSMNTIEQCEFRTGERFCPLTDDQLEQELRQFCTKFEWKDIRKILGKSFDVHQTDIPTSLSDSLSHNQIISNDYSKLSSVDAYTLEIMNSGREIFEIDRFVSSLMDESRNVIQTNDSLGSTKSDLSSSPLSPVFDEILLTDSRIFPRDTNKNALVSSDFKRDSVRTKHSNRFIETKICSLIGSYFINSPSIIENDVNSIIPREPIDSIVDNYLKENHLKSIIEFSLHQQFDSLSPSVHGLIKELTIDNTGRGHLYIDLTKTNTTSDEYESLKVHNKLKLYTINHNEFLLADIKSYTIDSNKQELYLIIDNFKLPDCTKLDEAMYVERVYNKEKSDNESIKYAQKDKSSEIKNTFIEKRLSYFENNDQQQLIEFIQNEIGNHQWPLQEYIGIKGQQAWRALKLAADISNFDIGFMLNYHQEIDWISDDNDFGSFTERTNLVIRNFQRRIENLISTKCQ